MVRWHKHKALGQPAIAAARAEAAALAGPDCSTCGHGIRAAAPLVPGESAAFVAHAFCSPVAASYIQVASVKEHQRWHSGFSLGAVSVPEESSCGKTIVSKRSSLISC